MKKVKYDQNNIKELTPEEVEGFKSTYGEVYLIEVEDKKCYLHKPDRATLDLAYASSKQKNSMFDETILKNSWLAGDKEIITNDDYFFGASKQLGEIVKFKESSLKKL